MRVPVSVGETDDPGFIELIDFLIEGLLAQLRPEQLWIINIDNWFDHKWLKFSGYGLAASEIPLDRWDTVKVEFYRDKLTFPPFTPNRVLGQLSYQRNGERYVEVPLPRLPHDTRRKSTKLNLQRRVTDFYKPACFVWYSSNTVANGRGSAMVYTVREDQTECWFAAFRRHVAWILATTKGVSHTDIQQLLELGKTL